MNDERRKIEAFKNSPNSPEMARVRLSLKVPENAENLDYHALRKANSQALDNAIAAHLGVTVTDHDTWPDEFARTLASEWAAKLPDA